MSKKNSNELTESDFFSELERASGQSVITPDEVLVRLSEIIRNYKTSPGIKVSAIKLYLDKYESIKGFINNETEDKDIEFIFTVVEPDKK